jgi:hypothetical protein
MAPRNCEKFLFDPLNLGVKVTKKLLIHKFGNPKAREKVKDPKSGKGVKLIYPDKEIWLYTEEETIITYFSTKEFRLEIPKEINIGSSEQSVIDHLGIGTKKKNTRTYCNEDEIDCVRFQFNNKKTERIEWPPYTG